MTKAKVGQVIDIEKLKSEKALTAKVCCVEGCKSIGVWDSKGNNFFLIKGMCSKHYQRTIRYGSFDIVSCVRGEDRHNHPLYPTYKGMNDRCSNINSRDFKNYGGRGVRVCDEWLGLRGFDQFVLDMGERPANHSLDRKKVDEGYSKENCRWATIHQQAANKRNNTKTVGVSYNTARNTWVAHLNVDKVAYRKIFKTEQEAIVYRGELEKKYLQNGI